MASRSSPSRSGWATPAPSRRSTPTATSGLTPTTGPGRPWTTFCGLLRTPCGPDGTRQSKGPAQRLCPGLPWQTLYFLPEPQGQGALREGSLVPVTVALLAALAEPLSLAEESRPGAE